MIKVPTAVLLLLSGIIFLACGNSDKSLQSQKSQKPEQKETASEILNLPTGGKQVKSELIESKKAESDVLYENVESNHQGETEFVRLIPTKRISISEFKKAFAPFRPTPEVFTVENSTASSVSTSRGSRIFIPKDCFVNSSGRYEREPVKVEVKEFSNISAYMLEGLPTVSANRLLESGGVIYINATSSTGPLSIAEGKAIEISFPDPAPDPEMMIFLGQTDETTELIEWSLPKPQTDLVKKRAGKYHRFSYSWQFETWINDRKKVADVQDFSVQAPPNHPYKNAIAERLRFISAMQAMSSCFAFKIDLNEFISYYLQNYGNNLQNIDSKVYERICAVPNTERLKQTVALESLVYDDTLVDPFHYIKDQFYIYSAKKPWMKEFGDYGIDLASGDALKLLKAKYKAEEAKEIIEYYTRVKEIEKHRQQAIQKFTASYGQEQPAATLSFKSKTRRIAYYTFEVKNLGWINIDKFYEDKRSAPVAVLIGTEGSKEAPAKVGIIFKNIKSYLPLHLNDNEKFTLSKDGIIPHGEEVVIVAMHYEDGKFYFGQLDAQIGSELTGTIKLEEIKKDEFKTKVATLDQL